MEQQQQQQDSFYELKKMYDYERSMKPNQLFEEVERVIWHDDVERLEWLFLTFHFNLHAERLNGILKQTPLTYASYKGSSHSVDKLLEWGADVNREDGSGWQPIHAAAYGGSIDCFDLLIFHVDRSKRDFQRKFILTRNAWKGHGEPTNYLVPYNHFRGDIDVRDCDGRTSLHLAAYMNHIEVVHYLLNLGADINAKNKRKGTPLHLAVSSLLAQQQTTFHLWFEGAGVNARDWKNRTPLDMAREKLRESKGGNKWDWKQIVAMLECLIEDRKKHDCLHRYVETLRYEITDKSLSKLSHRIKKFQLAYTKYKIYKLKQIDQFYHDYLLEHYMPYFLNKLKQDTDDLAFLSRFSENKEHVDDWFEDEEF